MFSNTCNCSAGGSEEGNGVDGISIDCNGVVGTSIDGANGGIGVVGKSTHYEGVLGNSQSGIGVVGASVEAVGVVRYRQHEWLRRHSHWRACSIKATTIEHSRFACGSDLMGEFYVDNT